MLRNLALDNRRGPSFIFLGTSRAGSSWFFEILREHPDIVTPANKGTFFFTKLHHMGPDWYEGFFPAKLDGRARGEVCEEYLSSPESLHRIRQYWPDMRLICCLRNPYERALSAWRFFGRNGVAEPSLAAEGGRYPDLFQSGFYATHLHLARSLFPENQILVFLFDDLLSAPEEVVRKLYQFIGVDPQFRPPSLRRRVNGGGRPRLRLLARLVHDIHMRSWGPSRLASNLVGTIKRSRWLRRAVTMALYQDEPPSTDWADHLSEFPEDVVVRYEQEIGALEAMLTRDLTNWRAPVRHLPGRAESAGQAGPAISTLRSPQARRESF